MAGEFDVHILNKHGLAQASEVASAFAVLLASLDALGTTPGHERALVITKLQEAAFFAKRAVALDPRNWLSLNPDH